MKTYYEKNTAAGMVSFTRNIRLKSFCIISTWSMYVVYISKENTD